MAAFGSAALICHGRKFMLLQKGRIKGWEESRHPQLVGAAVARGFSAVPKPYYGNDKLLLVLLSQKIINNRVFTPPITTTCYFSLVFTLVVPRVCKYTALRNSYGLCFPHLGGSCLRPTGLIATGVESLTPPLQLFMARDSPRKHLLSSKIIASCF